MTTVYLILAGFLLANAALPSVLLSRLFDKRWHGGALGFRLNLVPVIRIAAIVGAELLLYNFAGLGLSIILNGIALFLAHSEEFMETMLEWIIGPIRF